MINTPHDKLFKAVFSKPQNAREVLRTVLPPGLVRHLDFATLTPLPTTYIDKQFRTRFSDLLFAIQCDGHTAFLYLLFEHQSSSEPLMPFRQLRYMTDVWLEYLRENPNATRLPLVIPVVLHHGADGWSTPTIMGALYDLPAEVLAEVAGLVPDFSL